MNNLFSNKKTSGKKIKINSKIVYIATFLLIGLFIVAVGVLAINIWYEGYRINSPSTNVTIKYSKPGGFGCGYVDNYTGTSIFVPTMTEAEWLSFANKYFAYGLIDGCTGDANNYSGNTNWYTSTNNCGSWDYNCDGTEEKRWPEATGNIWVACFGPCTEGYLDDPTPACGQSASFHQGNCIFIPLPLPIWGCTAPQVTQECH